MSLAEFSNTIEFEEVCNELKNFMEKLNQFPLTIDDIKKLQMEIDDIFIKREIDIRLLFIESKKWNNVSLVGIREVDKMFLIAYSYWKKFRELEASIDMEAEKG